MIAFHMARQARKVNKQGSFGFFDGMLAYLGSRHFTRLAIIILCFSVILWLVVKLQDPETMPIKKVIIKGNYHYVDKRIIQKRLLPYVDAGFFSIDVKDIQQVLTHMPWIANASVARKWPDEIVITIKEQQPVALWRDELAFNQQGEVFHTAGTPLSPEFALLLGPKDKAQVVYQVYLQAKQEVQALNLKIRQITLTDSGAWTLKLDNGVSVLLGQKTIEHRLKRFVTMYPKVFEKNASNIKSIDMRYSNGMAVRWRDGVNVK